MSSFRLINHKHAPLLRFRPPEFISNEKDLQDALQQALLRSYPEFTFSSPEGDELFVAIADNYGFVQFTGRSGGPPYLYATRLSTEMNTQPVPSFQLPLLTLPSQGEETRNEAMQVRTKEKLIEFNIGGTPTRMPVSHCVSVQDALDIVKHYFQHKELATAFEWKEV